jgi:hypothetical protein
LPEPLNGRDVEHQYAPWRAVETNPPGRLSDLGLNDAARHFDNAQSFWAAYTLVFQECQPLFPMAGRYSRMDPPVAEMKD